MKKNLIFAMGLVSITAFAQETDGRVGINTTEPNASLDITRHTEIPATNPQGLILPRLTTEQRDAFVLDIVKQEGLMIYNLTKKCIDWFDGSKWQCMSSLDKDYYTPNVAADSNVKAQLWDRTLYFASFNYWGTNMNGVIANSGENAISVKIAYNEATVGGAYNEINVVSIATDKDGSKKTLTLNIPAGTFSAAKGFLTGTIKVGNGTTDTYNLGAKSLNTEETFATFKFSINGRAANVNLVVSGGILDKKFDQETNSTLEHQFIYIPVSAYPSVAEALPDTGQPYDKKWLNNNLGANYAKVGNSQHNKQATAKNDKDAYGYLYEWGRDSDGHEVIDWSSATAGTFAHPELHNFSWTNAPQTNAEDPCPTSYGYRTPTKEEFDALYAGLANNNKTLLWRDTTLNLPGGGNRAPQASTLRSTGSLGDYWATTPNANDYGYRLSFNSTNTAISHYYRTYGFAIRCIADGQ